MSASWLSVATIAAFVLSSAYYVVFSEQLAEVSDAAAVGEQPPPWKLAIELLRSLILAAVVAGLAAQGEIDEWTHGLLLGLALWIAFPFVLLDGRGDPREHALEARRAPRRRLAGEAALGGGHRERLAVDGAARPGAFAGARAAARGGPAVTVIGYDGSSLRPQAAK